NSSCVAFTLVRIDEQEYAWFLGCRSRGVAAFGTMLAFYEQPTACPCNSSSSPNPWYPCIHNPCPKETLTVQSYRINTPTNLTLNILNAGASRKLSYRIMSKTPPACNLQIAI